MNKKLIIGIVTTAVAVLLIGAILLLNFFGVWPFNNKDTDDASSESTTSSVEEVIKNGVIEFGAVSVKAGDNFTIPVKLKSNPGIWGIQLSIEYDAEKFKVSACSNGKIFDDFNYSDDGNGTLRLLIMTSKLKNISKNGSLCNLVLTALDNVEAGEYEFRVTNDSLATSIQEDSSGNLTETTIIPEIVIGKITVS